MGRFFFLGTDFCSSLVVPSDAKLHGVYLYLLTPALLQKCNLNIQKAPGYGHVLSSIIEFPSRLELMSVTFFEIFCKVVNLSQPNIGNYALE